MLASLRESARGSLLQVLKTSVAAILAWLLSSVLIRQELPIFAAIAALLVVQPSVNQSLAKGIERSVGVILGVVIAYAAGQLLGDDSWVVLSVIVVSLLVAWALKLTPGSSNQIPISAMLVLAIGAQTVAYALDRVLETVIGAVVGLIVNALIVPPVLVAPARLAVGRLASSVASSFERLATALRTKQSREDLDALLEEVRGLRPLEAKAIAELNRAEESLTFNPRAPRYRPAIEEDRRLIGRMSILVNRVIGMTRAVHDNYGSDLLDDPVVGSIAIELDRAAHDTRLLARDVGAKGSRSRRNVPGESRQPITAELPALTAPLVIAKPDPRHWILVGSLMEDLRRIREEITGEEGG